MPTYGGKMLINDREYTYSYIGLNRPTGKYIAQVILKLLNLLLKKHFLRHLGNPMVPGVDMPLIDPQKGISQLNHFDSGCGIVLANIAGSQPVRDAIVIAGEPFMVIYLHPDWKNFGDYKTSLTSKYRTRTNRVYALSENITRRNLTDEGLQYWIPLCADLLFETIKNKTITIGSDLALIMQTYHSVLKEKYQVWGYFDGERLIGFIAFMISQKEIFAMHLGYDVKVGTPLHLYQRMMYDLIDYSISTKTESLNLGRTAPEIKSTLGAVPVENSFVLFSRNTFFKSLIKIYATKFHKTTNYVLRHPFKE